MEQIQRVLAIPAKKAESRLVRHLGSKEMQFDSRRTGAGSSLTASAIAPCFTCASPQDYASPNSIGLRVDDLKLQPQASVLIRGKGRRERCLPLWKQTASALRAWLAMRGVVLAPELFVNARGEAMTRSGFEYHPSQNAQKCRGALPFPVNEACLSTSSEGIAVPSRCCRRPMI